MSAETDPEPKRVKLTLRYTSEHPNMKSRFDSMRVMEPSKEGLVELQKCYFDEIHIKPTNYYKRKDDGETVKETRILNKKEFTTLHTYGYYGIFKPDLAEVLSQLPEEIFANEGAPVYITVELGGPNFIPRKSVMSCDIDKVDEVTGELRMWNCGADFHHGVTTVYEIAPE